MGCALLDVAWELGVSEEALGLDDTWPALGIWVFGTALGVVLSVSVATGLFGIDADWSDSARAEGHIA